ncbi:MAG: UDP-2,3-diacylglucosamine diphosphatase [Burkholderiales bacterium]|nr:UDP-2,3-diacylglucosamine diphosphatase [Burkholderiales bacterium]
MIAPVPTLELAAQRTSWFVSDLHLSPERPAMRRVFGQFLRQAPAADALFILGDLFDYWIGDDDLADPFHAAVAADLAALAERGCALHLMQGNRDFLLGEHFARAAKLELLPDAAVIAGPGRRTLLLHGDTLCLDDPDYQAFRSKVHAPDFQRAFLAKSLDERRAIALDLRADSQSSQKAKPDEIMDVAPRAVADAFRRYDCTRMIHGHTHRPARHEHVVDGRRRERWVLGDWYGAASFLRCDERGECEAIRLACA